MVVGVVFGLGLGAGFGAGDGLGDVLPEDDVEFDFVPVEPEDVDAADRLKLADFSAPFQTLCSVEFWISVGVDPGPGTILTDAVPLASTLKLIDTTS